MKLFLQIFRVYCKINQWDVQKKEGRRGRKAEGRKEGRKEKQLKIDVPLILGVFLIDLLFYLNQLIEACSHGVKCTNGTAVCLN